MENVTDEYSQWCNSLMPDRTGYVSPKFRDPVCIDCIREGHPHWRPIAEGCGPRSPRCATHVRAEKKRRREMAHGRRIVTNFEMTPEQYAALYAYQGGRCWICRKATGKAKHLAVEHEHNLEGCEHPPERGCPRCWRALCCGRCNELVAFLDVDALVRAIILLTDPPARKLFLVPPSPDIAAEDELSQIYEGPLEDTSDYWDQIQ